MSALIILQWTVRVLLILLAIILVLLLILLLVPIRYQGEFSVEDPEPHTLPEWDRVLHAVTGVFKASWLGPVLRLTVEWQDELQMDLQILFTHRDPRTLLHGKDEESEQENAGQERPTSTPGERIRDLYRKIDYYKRVLGKEETGYTLDKGRRIILQTLGRILPRRWQLEGDVGLGDPARAARVLEIQGMLIPFTAGHVQIRPEFMEYQMNGAGCCKGSIRLIHLVIPAVQLSADRRVRQTIRRIRNADRNIERHYTQSAVNGG